jgi:hypothetical protein
MHNEKISYAFCKLLRVLKRTNRVMLTVSVLPVANETRLPASRAVSRADFNVISDFVKVRSVA